MAALRRARWELPCKVVGQQWTNLSSCGLHTRNILVSIKYTGCGCKFQGFFLGAGQRLPRFLCASDVRYVHTSSTNNKRDYYEVLGVSKNADQAAIKKAYYKLAKQFHPDMNKNDPNAAKKFQEVSEAYEVLSDDSRRQEYDTFGMSGANASAGAGAQGRGGFQQGFQGFEHFHGTIDPEELFRRIFGDAGMGGMGGMGGFGNFRDFEESKFGFAPASEMMMDLTFQEAARGVNKEVHINVKDTCPKCQGNKAEPGTKAVKCHQCNGTGMETISTGPFVMRSTCRACGGARMIIKTPCTECAGKGKIILKKKVVVPVPAGVEDGQTVRMPVGNQEVFITFKVAKSRHFRRDGADIHSDALITLSQAILGGTIRIPGIHGDILLTIPPGTQSHDRIRLQGKGITRVNSYGYGDHYVHIKIKVPVKLTPEQKALILAFAETDTLVDGTVNGVTQTQAASGEKVTGERLSSEDEEEGILAKIKRKLFG
ncbi:protein tumorous imaginal discs, mitochondrial-like isoform X2 [Pomacea canaliculata]|uniref:protein tumorous imaginal discs, mitochondrial-like isoform X2 n=1 Tax=Pomacea canaliculata TaxID=400727 RepID=UPI000D7382E3|nr:protein tumorous imaginal discs, mitochondrial-like isoform X2 [Pomacea canaliculata]